MKHHKLQIQPKRDFVSTGFMFPAFHAGDWGSNPLGDANITHGYDREVEKHSLPCLRLGLNIGPGQGPNVI